MIYELRNWLVWLLMVLTKCHFVLFIITCLTENTYSFYADIKYLFNIDICDLFFWDYETDLK